MGLLNGVAGCMTNSSQAYISSVWFPEEERGLATAICIGMAYLGICMSFLIGPLVVKTPTSLFGYFYIQLVIVLVAGLSMLAYFPNKPEHPPSYSAAYQVATDFRQSWRDLRGKDSRHFWILLLGSQVVNGVFGLWQAE